MNIEYIDDNFDMNKVKEIIDQLIAEKDAILQSARRLQAERDKEREAEAFAATRMAVKLNKLQAERDSLQADCERLRAKLELAIEFIEEAWDTEDDDHKAEWDYDEALAIMKQAIKGGE